MKRLSLKAERLSELTAEDLQQAVGGTYSFPGTCLFSLHKPCITFICSVLECIND